MAVAKIGAINMFLWQYTNPTYSLVGCATSLNIERTNNSIKIACQNQGSAIGKEYGSQDNKGSIDGLHFAYTVGEEAAQWTRNDFITAMQARTKVTFRVGEATTGSGKKLDEFVAIITSVSESTSLSGDTQGSYSVNFEIDGSITEITLP
jgi:hypothetical protein